MNSTRREFLHQTLVGGTAIGLSALFPRTGLTRPVQGQKLRLLILGGTSFLGPHTVRAALARGHTMTLFNRGKTNPQLFPELEKLRGDRKNDLKALEGREWDAVIDTSGYVPRHVQMSAELLAKTVQQYVFISSISVHENYEKPGMDETAPVGKLDDESVEQITALTYGPLKALCEQAAEKALPGRVTNIRPGLIVGPEDPSDRFTYWPVRVARGGEVLAPGSGSDFIQFIDVRDLAEWIVACIENKVVGVFNADRPAAFLTMKAFLDECKTVAKSDARFVWAPPEFLAAHGVQPWGDMPVWIPAVDDNKGFGQVSTAKAASKGLKHRPMAETIGDTLKWFRELPAERQAQMKSGLKPEREQEVLKAWHEQEHK